MDNRINIAVIIGVVLVLAFAVTFTQTEKQAVSQDESLSFERSAEVDQSEKTISVVGTASSSVEPDTLLITFGVETQSSTAKESLSSNSAKLQSAIDAIRSVGISDDDLSTSQFSIYPIYDSYQDKITGKYTQELIGYRASNILTVETSKLSSAASIIDSAVAAGANRVDSVTFTLSPEILEKEKDALIENAVLDARQKATKALDPLGYKIIGVKSVVLSDGMTPYYEPKMRASYDSFAESAPVFSSDQDVSTSASVVFLIGPK